MYICGTERNRGKIFSREDNYFRGKLFSREDIFAGRYVRVNSIYSRKYLLAKISQIRFSRKFPSAKITYFAVMSRIHRVVCIFGGAISNRFYVGLS